VYVAKGHNIPKAFPTVSPTLREKKRLERRKGLGLKSYDFRSPSEAKTNGKMTQSAFLFFTVVDFV
jgi:hypothetical protein